MGRPGQKQQQPPVAVFHAKRRAPPPVPHEFATGEDVIADDHLVYPVPGEVSSVLSGAAHNGQQVSNRDPESGTEEHEMNTIARPKEPSLRIAKGSSAKKPLYFESIVQGAFSEALLDSGASHSFVSAAFCREPKISWRRMELAGGRQADGSEFAVLGKLCNATVKLGPLREKQPFWLQS